MVLDRTSSFSPLSNIFEPGSRVEKISPTNDSTANRADPPSIVRLELTHERLFIAFGIWRDLLAILVQNYPSAARWPLGNCAPAELRTFAGPVRRIMAAAHSP